MDKEDDDLLSASFKGNSLKMISVLRFHLPVCIKGKEKKLQERNKTWEYLSCLYKRKLLLNKKGNLLARIPKLAISLSCLSWFLSGTLGQSRSAGNMSFPPPVREKQSDTAGSSFAKRERGSKNTILKAIRPSLSARFHLLTIMQCIMQCMAVTCSTIRCSEVLP